MAAMSVHSKPTEMAVSCDVILMYLSRIILVQLQHTMFEEAHLAVLMVL